MEIYRNENVLCISLDGNINFRVSNLLHVYQADKNFVIDLIHLDFTRTRSFTLPGLMMLVLLVNRLLSIHKTSGHTLQTDLDLSSDYQIGAIANYGFFVSMTVHGGLKNNELLTIEYGKRKFWNLKIKAGAEAFKKIYWPIANIPKKEMTGYEQDISKFFNDFVDYFDTIQRLGMFVATDSAYEFYQRNFLKAINEIIKNIWDHSESWGIASIVSEVGKGTTLCIFDNGIGFINSYIKQKGVYERGLEADKKVLEWLFIEGNTSRESSNHGHGLSVIKKFAELTKGILLISTDAYLIECATGKDMKISAKPFFPGTQIMINF